MKFSSLVDFDGQVEFFVSKKNAKEGYYSFRADLVKEISRFSSFKDLWANATEKIFEAPHFKIIKLSVPNSAQKLARNNAFRVILLLSKQAEEVCFLYCYPKRGKLSQITVKSDYLMDLFEKFVFLKENESLDYLDINLWAQSGIKLKNTEEEE